MHHSRFQEFRKYQEQLASAQSARRQPSVSVESLYNSFALAARADSALTRYMNSGYWHRDTSSLDQAGDNLMKLLVEGMQARLPPRIPEEERILDVACGLGSTTRYLCRSWLPQNVYAINISQQQLDLCRRTAPGCRFHRMEATSLEFADGMFDRLICVEAAFQFRTRDAFLREAHRVLKPGGTLALSDLLLIPEAHQQDHAFLAHHPKENHCASPERYRDLVLGAGFRECTVLDITAEGYGSYFTFFAAHLHALWRDGKVSFQSFRRSLDWLHLQECTLAFNIICIAIR